MPKEGPRKIRLRLRPLLFMLPVLLTVATGGLLSGQVSRAVYGESGSPLGDLLPSFGPAALFAAGRGMILPLNGMPPELNAFLNGETTHFDPALLPTTFSGPHIFGAYADTFPLTHWLLFYCVGWTWRLFGIHYGALHLLVGIMGAFTTAALYALFRLGMNRFFACAGALLTMLLPPFLLMMPSLRDFSKAPFILIFIALSGALLTRKRRPAALFRGALCLALVPGIGYGFRQDILICLPVAAAVILAIPLNGKYRLFLRISALAVFVAVFGLLASPVLRGMRHESGSVTTHTLFQGLSREAEQTMYFGDASYDLLLTPSDPETHATVNAHARMHGMTEPMPLYLSPAYARAGRALFHEWVLTFPADLFARGLASIESVQRLSSLTLESPHYVETGKATGSWHLLSWHVPYAKHIEPLAPLFIAAALLLLGLQNRKHMLAVIFILGYFMAYPSLLFQVRHAFHLAFVVPWAILFSLQKASGAVLFLFSRSARGRFFQKRGHGAYTGRALLQTTAMLAVIAAGCALTLSALRFVQRIQVSRMIEPYRAAALTPIATTMETGQEYHLFRPERQLPGLEESWNLPLGDAATSYLAVSLEPAEYAFPLQVLYTPRRGAYMTRQFIIPAASKGARETLYFIPIYELADYKPAEFLLAKHRFNNTPLANLLVHPLGTNKFAAIGLRPDAAHLFKRLYYVNNHTHLPWLLYLRTTDSQRDFVPYKRFGFEKALQMLPVEFRLFRTQNVENAVSEYFDLLSRFPGYRPYAGRIKELIPRLPTPVARAEALFGLSGYELYTGGAYATALAEIAGQMMAGGAPEQAEAVYRRAVALAPEDLWHQAHLADALMAQGNTSEAIPLYSDILRRAPESPYCAKQFDNACLQTDQADGALDFWEALHRDAPDAIVPALHLARAYEQRMRWQEAISLYERLLETHKDHFEITLRYGALVATTEFARGRALMDQALKAAPELKPDYINELARLAGIYAESGNHAFAEALYWEIASLSPEDPEHVIHLADILAANGEWEKAIEQYAMVLKSKPESPYSADRLRELLGKVGTPEEQVKQWEALHDLHPIAIVPALFLARAYEETDRWVEALALYHLTLDRYPGHAETQMRYGILMAVKVDANRGSALMDRALAAAPELKSLQEAGLIRLAAAQAESGDVGAAIATYRKLAALSPEDLRHVVNLADTLAAAGQSQDACNYYKAVLQKAPDSPYSAGKADELLKKSGDNASRIQFWEELNGSHPDAYLPWFYLGMANEDIGNYDAARQDYIKALEIEPSSPALKLRFGAVVARMGPPENGIALLREAVGSAPELHIEGARTLAEIAADYERHERSADAEALYREAMLLAPEDSWNSYNLGVFYMKQERMDKAFPLLRAILCRAPDSPLTAESLDAIYLAREDKEGRIAFWRDMVDKHPDAAVPLYHLGLALEAGTRIEESAAAYQRALNIQPQMQDAQKRLQELSNSAAGKGR